MSRGNSKISRDTSFSAYSTEEPSWAKEYSQAVEKYSVKSKSEDAQFFDQINQILGNSKSKYSTVDEAVLDMQKRTGLYEILQKKANSTPELFKKFPDLEDFIKDRLDAFPGSAVDAIVQAIMEEPRYKNALPNGETVPEEVEEYINQLKTEIDSRNGHKDLPSGMVDVTVDNKTHKDNNPLNILSPNSL